MASISHQTSHRWVYRSLADTLVVFHAIWAILIFGGAIAMFFYPPYAFIEILVLSITLLSNLPFRLSCPFTLLEGRLRRKVNPRYDNNRSFVGTYINKVFGTHFTNRTVDWVIGILYVLFYTYAVLMLLYK
jgi:hypothetical protein